MPQRSRSKRAGLPPWAALIALLLSGCSSLGDFDRLRPDLIFTDDIHSWVGRDAARAQGAPISFNDPTDEERLLRDLAFPLIEPPYDRQRWDALLLEYGATGQFAREIWEFDPSAYYRHLHYVYYHSSVGRYQKLIDDMRSDVTRIGPFFDLGYRVLDLDRRREAAIKYVADLDPDERHSALARIGENRFTIAWVQHALEQRVAGYRFALQHLTVAEPERIAADAEVTLTQLQQQVAAYHLVPPLHLPLHPHSVAAQETIVSK